MSPVATDEFRRVVGHFATGVAVITGRDADDPVGLTVVTFTSVSLDPMLVGFLPDRNSSSWPRIRSSGAFCVNVLAADQLDVAMNFARRAPDKFTGLSWHSGPSGSPVLDGALAWIDCELFDAVDAGDHWFAMGRVVALDADSSRDPLICFRGRMDEP